jgi:hypothetical protein
MSTGNPSPPFFLEFEFEFEFESRPLLELFHPCSFETSVQVFDFGVSTSTTRFSGELETPCGGKTPNEKPLVPQDADRRSKAGYRLIQLPANSKITAIQ